MLQYIFAGLALGGIYAIASSSLVVTFVSAGILNFAFGAMAFFVARFFYWMHTQHGQGLVLSALVSLLLVAPAFGVFLWAVLFRYLRLRSSLIKLVATIGLSVAIPPVANILFGDATITSAPGLAPVPVHVYKVFGGVVDLNAVITYICVIAVLVIGTLVLRGTDAGLKVRAMVDSEALTSLSGRNPNLISLAVWAASAFLAGLAGILVAPTDGLTPGGMTTLMAAAFAAVVAARLRSLPVAVGVSVLMGLVTEIIQKYLPANSSYTAAIVPSIPFGFILVFLIIYILRSGRVSEGSGASGALDRAIQTQDAETGVGTQEAPARDVTRFNRAGGGLIILLLALSPVIFHGFWLEQVDMGASFALVFLSFTLVTGEGGMIWLCQITFAGGGAIAAAQFATVEHLPVLLAVLLGGLIMLPIGALLGALTIRLGDLYVGLVTLSFGLLMETLVYTRTRFFQQGLGVVLNRPQFANGDRAFAYLALAVFAVIGILMLNLRRSTAGLALGAVRSSEPASETLGLSVLQMKVLVSGLAAFVAGIGGAFLAMDARSALPTSYPTFAGIIWLAVLVTIGVRSILGAAVAGMAFTLIPGIFTTYLSTKWGNVPPILFGLGAIGLATDPEGAAVSNVRRIRHLVLRSPAAGEFDDADLALPEQAPPQQSLPPAAVPVSSGGDQ
ncbi:ABC transporter permease [Acidiferrimicrobium sp. IK]|uniref:branched-chain amino acid ABC transporter permease n=1 Tax=Acidiferrimicrobium sp. IK TaxID=2871700 RepID=UPI0021CB970B|nr:ABC transporter permease [Acidiferrimicrobium sp. IK]MCU4183480.1 ABC transporter permease [Acidiferrimicrobium sp. IK]